MRVIKNHLVFQTDKDDLLQSIIPETRVANGWTAVPFTLQVCTMLRAIGVEAPSPIRTEYKWQGRYTPFQHQLTTSEFFTLNPRAFCLNGMGTGKTMSALWAADFLKQLGVIHRVLILSPLSTLDVVWSREIFTNFPNRSAAVLHGAAEKRRKLLAEPHDFYILNHHGVAILNEELRTRKDIDLIIVDEAACFPAGTKVLTPQGERCIETIKEGDLVVSSWGVAPVTAVFRNTSPKLITLNMEDGTHVTCTPNHPVATERGWLPASQVSGLRVVQDKDLQSMWESIFCAGSPPEVSAANDMLSFMQSEVCVARQTRRNDDWFKKSRFKETGDTPVEQGHPNPAECSGERAGAPQIPEGPVYDESRWEWNWDVENGTDSFDIVTRGVCLQLPCTDTKEARRRISYLLQSGLWKSYLDDCYRGGWDEPQYLGETGTRPEEIRTTHGVRVDSVSYHKQVSEGYPVWNIEVRGARDYIADGKVVHNCYRNSQTKMWKMLKSVIAADTWVWGMTGSPTPQAPTDAYGIGKLIRPENLAGQSFTRFKSEVMHQVGPFRWIPKRNSEQAVARILSPSLRYALRDCVDLPETIVQYRQVEMTPEQKHHYVKLLKDCVTEVKGVQVTAVNAAVLMSKIIQASCGVMYGSDGQVVKLDFSHRLSEVLDIIEECDEKIIIFVPLTGALHAVQSELKKRGHDFGIVEGDTSKGERLRLFDAVQTGTMKGLVANASAMAHGISLTSASTIVWFAPPYSNEVYEQANARIVRPGQEKVTNIVNLYSTKEERKILEGLQNKTKFMELVLGIIRDAK